MVRDLGWTHSSKRKEGPEFFGGFQVELLLLGYEVEFRYLYEELGENKVWIEEWEAQELLRLPLAVYVRFIPQDEEKESLEIVARIRNDEHRSIQPNDLEIRDL